MKEPSLFEKQQNKKSRSTLRCLSHCGFICQTQKQQTLSSPWCLVLVWQSLSTAPLLPCSNVSWAGLSQQLLASSSMKEKDTWEVCTALCWGHSCDPLGMEDMWEHMWLACRQHLLSHCWEIHTWCKQGSVEGPSSPQTVQSRNEKCHSYCTWYRCGECPSPWFVLLGENSEAFWIWPLQRWKL